MPISATLPKEKSGASRDKTGGYPQVRDEQTLPFQGDSPERGSERVMAGIRSRIILHTPEPVSSPALYIEALASALAGEGLTVDVACPGNLQTRAKLEGNPLISMHPSAVRSVERTRGLPQRILGNAKFLASSVISLVRTCRPASIVHFQYVLHFPFGFLFFIVARLRGCKIVFTVHDPLPHKWLLPELFRGWEKKPLAWAYKMSDALIVHSEPGKRALMEHFSIASKKISIVPHGPYSLGRGLLPMPDTDTMEVLLFGALRENKGAHLAIEAAQSLHREGVSIRLTIAGAVLNSKEREYWHRCRALIAAYPEPIRVMEEFIPDENLPALFTSCHCLVLPYTNFFSDSGVAYMALANGRPIIATNAGGLATLLKSSGGGIPIKEATVTGVADALYEAARLGAEQLEMMGRNGTARVMEECGWPLVARQTLKIYAGLFSEEFESFERANESLTGVPYGK